MTIFDDERWEYYTPGCADPIEARMRSEFLAMVDIEDQAKTAAAYGNARGQAYNRARAREVDAEWRRSDRAADWAYLSQAFSDWSRFPKQMGDPGQATDLTEMQRRSQFQARSMTGRGTWPWSKEAAGTERPPIPGHPFAGLVTGREQDKGMER